jgi:hypothetical protein
MRCYRLVSAICALCLAWPMCQGAQANDDPDVLPVIKFHVTARGEPTPALRYRFLPTFREMKPGNAALVYAKLTVKFEGSRSEVDNRIGGEWLETPVEKLPRAEVDKDLSEYDYMFADIERAVRMETCDWQLNIRSEKPWEIRIPEVQGMRQLARALIVKVRLQIHDRKYDDAIRTLQTGFAMARQVAQGETLVNALVGVAITSLLLNEVETLMQAPDAPNLYWALTSLPRPLIDMQKSLSAEMHFVDFSIPSVQDIRHANYTADQWRELLNKMDHLLIDINGGDNSPDANRMLSTALAARTYPLARQYLIDGGLSAEAVDKMPVPQVVAIHKVESFDRLRDNLFKWMYLPIWQRQAGVHQSNDAIRQANETLEGFPLSQLLPAPNMAMVASVRPDRRVASLAAVNALRIHAAANDGKLPATLAEIKLAPVLADPTTGQPFGYSLSGATATLTSPPLPGLPASVAGLHYEITIAP